MSCYNIGNNHLFNVDNSCVSVVSDISITNWSNCDNKYQKTIIEQFI